MIESQYHMNMWNKLKIEIQLKDELRSIYQLNAINFPFNNEI